MKCPACQRLLCDMDLRDGSVLLACRGTKAIPKHMVRFQREPGDAGITIEVDAPRIKIVV